jgi:hypothetical protein
MLNIIIFVLQLDPVRTKKMCAIIQQCHGVGHGVGRLTLTVTIAKSDDSCAPKTQPLSYPSHPSAASRPSPTTAAAGDMLTCGRFLSSSAATTTASFFPLRTLTRSLLRRPTPRLLSAATAVEPDTKGRSF